MYNMPLFLGDFFDVFFFPVSMTHILFTFAMYKHISHVLSAALPPAALHAFDFNTS